MGQLGVWVVFRGEVELCILQSPHQSAAQYLRRVTLKTTSPHLPHTPYHVRNLENNSTQRHGGPSNREPNQPETPEPLEGCYSMSNTTAQDHGNRR